MHKQPASVLTMHHMTELPMHALSEKENEENSVCALKDLNSVTGGVKDEN